MGARTAAMAPNGCFSQPLEGTERGEKCGALTFIFHL